MNKVAIYSNTAAELAHVAAAVREKRKGGTAVDARYFNPADLEKTERVVFLDTGDPLDDERFDAIEAAYSEKGVPVERIKAGDPAAIAEAIFPTEPQMTAKERRAAERAAKIKAAEDAAAKMAGEPDNEE